MIGLYCLIVLALAGTKLEAAVTSLASSPDGKIESLDLVVALRATGLMGCGWRDM
jgi:hypothetical protein